MRTAALLPLACLPTLLAAQAPTPSVGATIPRAELVARLDSLARAAVADRPLPSVSVAVVRGRDTLLLRGYGLADLENEVPATPASVYRIGSLTKSFTAAAVMQQVERGRIALDDEVGRHFPEYSGPGRRATLRQLLNHTSGIQSYGDLGERMDVIGANEVAQDSIVAVFAPMPLLFEPGTRYSYSNANYFLLGMLLERVSGMRYADYVRTELAPRAGLTATRTCDQRALIPHRAQGYLLAREGWINARPMSVTTTAYAAGALCSTARDLVAWIRALREGRVVSAASYRAMTTSEGAARSVTPSDTSAHYGYGLHSRLVAGHRLVGHIGAINGFNATALDFPAESLTIAVLVNGNMGPPEESDVLGRQLAAAAFGMPLPAPTPPRQFVALGREMPTTAAERARIVGRYALPLRDALGRPTTLVRAIRIYEENGRLMVQTTGGAPDRLVALGSGVYSPENIPRIRYTFTLPPDTTQPATAILAQNGSGTTEGRRR